MPPTRDMSRLTNWASDWFSERASLKHETGNDNYNYKQPRVWLHLTPNC